MDAPLLSVIKRAEAIYIAIKEVHCLQAECQVKNALAIRNSPNTTSMLSLPIFLEVCIWRKKHSWNGLYKLLTINSKIYIINIPYRSTNF